MLDNVIKSLKKFVEVISKSFKTLVEVVTKSFKKKEEPPEELIETEE